MSLMPSMGMYLDDTPKYRANEGDVKLAKMLLNNRVTCVVAGRDTHSGKGRLTSLAGARTGKWMRILGHVEPPVHVKAICCEGLL